MKTSPEQKNTKRRAPSSKFALILSLRRAREASALHQRKIRVLLGNVSDAVVELDHEGCVLGWNPACERRFGWSKPEAAKKKLSELILAPWERPLFDPGLSEFHDGAWIVTTVHKEGFAFLSEVRSAAIRQPGNPPTWMVVLRPVEERSKGFVEQAA